MKGGIIQEQTVKCSSKKKKNLTQEKKYLIKKFMKIQKGKKPL